MLWGTDPQDSDVTVVPRKQMGPEGTMISQTRLPTPSTPHTSLLTQLCPHLFDFPNKSGGGQPRPTLGGLQAALPLCSSWASGGRGRVPGAAPAEAQIQPQQEQRGCSRRLVRAADSRPGGASAQERYLGESMILGKGTCGDGA